MGVLVALLGGVGSASALDAGKTLLQFPHRAWQAEDGLPQNSILSLAQTPDGYLWAGTLEGLVRFDGVRFAVFDETNTPALPDRSVRGLALGRDGTLWIGTDKGLAGMRQGTFFPVAPASGANLRGIARLMAASDGSLWIATDRDGLFQLSENRLRAWTTGGGLASDAVKVLAEDSQGAVWVGSTAGVQRWTGTAWTAPLPFEGQVTVSVHALTFDLDGTLWAGTKDGEVYRLQDGSMRRVREASLPGTPIVSLLVDRAGTLWVGSLGQGPLRLGRGPRSRPDAAHALAGSMVTELLEDAEGNLWIGTDARGLHRLKDAPITSYGPPEGLAHEVVLAIHEARDGSLWFATLGGGVTRWRDGQMTSWTRREGLLQDWISVIAEGSDGSLWFGSPLGISRWHSGEITTFSEARGVPLGRVRALYEDARGTLWAGTEKGLARWNGERFEPFTPPGGLPGGGITFLRGSAAGGVWVGTLGGGLAHLQDDRLVLLAPENGPTGEILALHEDPPGSLWIGTLDGLYRWKAGHFTRLTRAQGLFDNRIFQILPDGRGQLWMSCNKGLFRVSEEALNAVAEGRLERVESHVYGTEDGMRSAECNGVSSPAGIRARDGRLWFPTIRGAVAYTPEQEEQRTAPWRALIEEVRVDGRTVPPSEWDHIPVGGGDVEIHYTSPGLRAPQRLNFRYQLEGIDADWVEAGPRRVAYYTHLPPGHHLFRVVAKSTEGGPPSPKTELRFYLEPRFHQTLWFRLLCVLAAVLGVAGAVWLRIYRLRLRERELQARVDQRTAELASVNADLSARLVELQNTRERLVHAEKMAAVGTLAAGVGHEINNPLAFIISNLHYASEEVREAARDEGNGTRWKEVDEALYEALQGADRVRRIVQDLRTFSRVTPEEPRRVELHAVLESALSIADRQVRYRARVVKDYGPVSAVLGDETRLGQVFLNLLINAAQAIPEGHTDSNEIRVTTRQDDQGRVVVSVSDTGTGIPSEVLPHIFEPFFTTKPVGVGTGLGLSISHTHIQTMGGELRVRSEPGSGATFEVVLPPAS
ncbi:sensor histidine kinase [Archangium sp.]|uniref:sensor histidine kinase n=1 Tax=Archangium sp. TaxID=1872627 RepID=UPI002D6306DD|nr:two-component regulator propeller domain-containing protein [Archangium sp.]HYO55026.1 two-component regulator propeller domain-containing protein [Archangium sp.]